MQEFLAQVQAVLGDGLQIIPVSEEGELSEKMRPVLEGQGLGSYDLWYEPVPVGELGDFSKPGPVSGTDCEAVDETEKGLLENEAFLEKIKGFRKYWIDKEGGGTWSPPTDSGDGGKPLCCVKKFLYPKPREEGDLERLTISDDIGVVPNDASKKTKVSCPTLFGTCIPSKMGQDERRAARAAGCARSEVRASHVAQEVPIP